MFDLSLFVDVLARVAQPLRIINFGMRIAECGMEEHWGKGQAYFHHYSTSPRLCVSAVNILEGDFGMRILDGIIRGQVSECGIDCNIQV